MDSKVRAAVEGAFALESVGALALRGFQRPVEAFNVVAAAGART